MRRRALVIGGSMSGLLAGLMGRKSGAGTSVALDGLAGLPDELISALETRAIWAKFGF